MPDILVTEVLTGKEIDALARSFELVYSPELWKQPETLIETLAPFRALMVRNQTLVSRELLSRASRLEVIGRAGVGLDNVDLDAATKYGVVVAFTPEQNTNSVAELTIGLILSLARRIPAADRDTRSGKWNRHYFTGIEVTGKTLGIAGLGRIGLSTATKARALGMEIVAHDPFVDPDSARVLELRIRMVTLDELLADADFVSCHLPATKDTRGLFSYGAFCKMKPGAFFINTSRGEVVDEDGLIRALEEGRLAGAALDVRSSEPAATGPLSQMENIILLPHIGAFTREAQQRVMSAVCRDVGAVLSGEPARHFANFARPLKGRMESP
jgi:(S)-sulfolactate dehydrogenase